MNQPTCRDIVPGGFLPSDAPNESPHPSHASVSSLSDGATMAPVLGFPGHWKETGLSAERCFYNLDTDTHIPVTTGERVLLSTVRGAAELGDLDRWGGLKTSEEVAQWTQPRPCPSVPCQGLSPGVILLTPGEHRRSLHFSRLEGVCFLFAPTQ